MGGARRGDCWGSKLMAKKPERWVTLGSTDWLAAQEWLPPLLAERAEERVAAAAYTAYRNTRPERKRPWEDGYTDKPRSAQEQALAKKAFRIRMSTDETRLKGAIAEIVEKYPTGDDTTSDRYQAHSFIRETEIVALFQKRWDAEALAFGRKTLNERRGGGIAGGGKAKRATKEAWQKNATPIYFELRAKFPSLSASALAWKIVSDPRVRVPGKGSVERWVSAMDKKPRPPTIA
jgi:hypothetical protein